MCQSCETARSSCTGNNNNNNQVKVKNESVGHSESLQPIGTNQNTIDQSTHTNIV